MDDILSIIKKKKKVYRITLMIISLIISATVYNLFLLPLNLVTGGTAGVATITNYVFQIEPAVMLLLLSSLIAKNNYYESNYQRYHPRGGAVGSTIYRWCY